MRGCLRLGLQLSHSQIRSFRVYWDLLRVWNPSTGLISSQDEHRVVSRHFLDSLSILKVIDPLKGARVMDVGSGGGFPGLPLKICRPAVFLALLEQKEKRFFFLKTLVKTLGLKKVTLFCRRAEEAYREPDIQEGFDLVLARAVASMEKLAQICLPFVRAGGLFVAYKSRRVEEELSRASRQIKVAGGELLRIVPVKVPGSPGLRSLVLIQKSHR